MPTTTERVLAERQARHERLWCELEATGLTSFSEQMEWLRAHRTLDELLAEDRRLPVPATGAFSRLPAPVVSKRVKSVPVIDAGRQMEIALAALEHQAQQESELEAEVRRLHGFVLTDREIAERIGVTPETVYRHRRRLRLPANAANQVVRRNPSLTSQEKEWTTTSTRTAT